MRILAKVGGAQLEQAGARAQLARSVARAVAVGHEVILVHGGGNQIRALVRRLGLAERYHEGLRVTDPDTAEVVLMVLAGLVNKELVRALCGAGARAAGLCGADGASFSARQDRSRGADLGYVGSVDRADPRLVETLLAAGFVPVIATAAPVTPGCGDPDGRFYNVNADLAVGPLARALRAEAVVFLTDVEGVLDGDRRRIGRLSPARCRELRALGVIAGGMIPKVEAALAALAAVPDGALVKIAPAAGEDALLAALAANAGTGFAKEEAWTSTS